MIFMDVLPQILSNPPSPPLDLNIFEDSTPDAHDEGIVLNFVVNHIQTSTFRLNKFNVPVTCIYSMLFRGFYLEPLHLRSGNPTLPLNHYYPEVHVLVQNIICFEISLHLFLCYEKKSLVN